MPASELTLDSHNVISAQCSDYSSSPCGGLTLWPASVTLLDNSKTMLYFTTQEDAISWTDCVKALLNVQPTHCTVVPSAPPE